MKTAKLFRDWDEVEEHPSGAVIFSERGPAEVVYVILSGEVELTLRGTTLGIEGEGGIIGETAVISGSSRSATAVARTNVRLARIDREKFSELVRDNPGFSLHAMTVFANRLRSIDDFISTELER